MQFSCTGCNPASRNRWVTSRTRSHTTGGRVSVSSAGLKLITRTYGVPRRCIRGIARRTSASVTSKGVSIVFAQFMMVEPKQHTLKPAPPDGSPPSRTPRRGGRGGLPWATPPLAPRAARGGPAEGSRGLDLRVEGRTRFVANAGEIHVRGLQARSRNHIPTAFDKPRRSPATRSAHTAVALGAATGAPAGTGGGGGGGAQRQQDVRYRDEAAARQQAPGDVLVRVRRRRRKPRARRAGKPRADSRTPVRRSRSGRPASPTPGVASGSSAGTHRGCCTPPARPGSLASAPCCTPSASRAGCGSLPRPPARPHSAITGT